MGIYSAKIKEASIRITTSKSLTSVRSGGVSSDSKASCNRESRDTFV